MKRFVFLEGVPRSGVTSIWRALQSWHRDEFSYFDHGPWGRYARGGSRRDDVEVRSALQLASRAAPVSVAVFVHRDAGAILRGDQAPGVTLTAEELAEHERLLGEAFAQVPPAHLLHVWNREGTTLDDLVADLQQRLAEIAGQPPSREKLIAALNALRAGRLTT